MASFKETSRVLGDVLSPVGRPSGADSVTNWAMGLSIAVVVLALWAVDRYGRYTAFKAVPSATINIPRLIDAGITPEGGLVAVSFDGFRAGYRLRVEEIAARGGKRDLYSLDPEKLNLPPVVADQRPIDTRISPSAARVASIWQYGPSTVLSIAQGRRADTVWTRGRARAVAISPDGAMVAISYGADSIGGRRAVVQVYRLSVGLEAAAGTSAERDVRTLAVSSSGRLAFSDSTGRVRVLGAGVRDSAHTLPDEVSALAFLDEQLIAAIGQFDGIHLISDSSGVMQIDDSPGGTLAGIAGRGDKLVAWDRDGRVRQFTLEPSRRFKGWQTALISIAAYFLVGIIMTWRRLSSTVQSLVSRVDYPAPSLPLLKAPKPSPEMIEACASGMCVVYAGAGLGAIAGYPIWIPFVRSLLDWAQDRNILPDPSFAESLQYSLLSGRANSVAFTIVSLAQQSGRGAELEAFLKDTFAAQRFAIPTVHKQLASIGFGAAVTHNLDEMLDKAFVSKEMPVYTYRDSENLLSALSRRAPFVLKLYGAFGKSPVLLTCDQFRTTLSSDLPFAEFNQQLYASRTLLFVGTSLQGILDYVESFPIRLAPNTYHFALVAVEEAGWEVTAKRLLDRYGIEVLPYSPSNEHAQLGDFLTALEKDVAAARAKGSAAAEVKRPAALTRLSLTNVGPFKRLDIPLDPNVTVVLGDNGVGKSTILKAFGLALAGSDGDSEKKLAESLIRSRKPDEKPTSSGADGDDTTEITLQTAGGNEYTTVVRRGALEGARVEFHPHTWQRGENRLVLGFPAMRGVSNRSVTSPQILPDQPRPLPSDVLPITKNEPDSRVSDLTQFLYSLDYKRRVNDPDGKVQRIMNDFGTSVDSLLEGVNIKFRDFKVVGGSLMVDTDDGPVPLQSLSQGTVSMIGLLAVLIPRLYDVYTTSKNPLGEFAIVLIDEVDAHMHPRWQQSMMSKLRELFPAVQFIVTTHSPFIAAGRAPNELVRLRRNPRTKEVFIEPTMEGTTGVDIATLLTGELFEIITPVDSKTQRAIVERRRLGAAKNPTKAQLERLDVLNKELAGVLTKPTMDPEYNRYLRAKGELASQLDQKTNDADPHEREKLEIAKTVVASMKAKRQKAKEGQS